VVALITYLKASPVFRHLVLSSFFENWKREMRWFELLILGRRVAIVVFLATVPSYGFSLPLSTICVLLLSLTLQQMFSPYDSVSSPTVSVLTSIRLTRCAVLFFVGFR
jgi:hypothetical protein